MEPLILEKLDSWSHLRTPQELRSAVADVLDPVCSYKVPGAFWAPAYKSGAWDGRARLLKRVRGQPYLAFPGGLTDRVYEKLVDNGFAVEVVDHRSSRYECAATEWTGPTPRPYQRLAAKRMADAAASRDPLSSGAIVQMPVRSGKTLTAALALHALEARAIFLVPSEHLLRQTHSAFKAFLGGASVSVYGDGDRDPSGGILVATIQSFERAYSENRSVYDAMMDRRWVLIVDEGHHCDGKAGGAWRDAVVAAPCRTKIGLTATTTFSEDDPHPDTALWLRAACGPVAYELTLREMVPEYLAPCTIRVVRHGAEKLPPKTKGADLYRLGVVECAARNQKIVEEAANAAQAGHRVLIDAAQVRHTRALHDLVRKLVGPHKVAMVTGKTSTRDREAIVRGLRSGAIPIVVGTVLGEGVDVPELDVVVNAEGGKGYEPTLQRMRCLTPCEGKEKAYMIEMADDHHSSLRRSLAKRLEHYAAEGAFEFDLP